MSVNDLCQPAAHKLLLHRSSCIFLRCWLMLDRGGGYLYMVWQLLGDGEGRLLSPASGDADGGEMGWFGVREGERV